MLIDTKLRNLKPRDKLYKVNDRAGLYVTVTPACSISFRYNYSINGRHETITYGRYGVGGITLAEAREQLGDAKKMVAAGKSAAKEKVRDKARVKGAETSFAGGSDFVLPSRYGLDAPMSSATLNQVLTLTYKAAQKYGKSLTKFADRMNCACHQRNPA